MEKRWTYKPLHSTESTQQFADAINVSFPIATLLRQRGIHDFESAKNFFRPSFEHLHDPFLMKDMDKAVWRLEEAIRNKEKIMVYGDYDVDGTTAVVLIYGFLLHFYKHLLYYTPDRYGEGYGVSVKGIDWAKEQGVSLIICLDCGIKSNQSVSYAKSLGIDFVICDHHVPSEVLPDAYAVLDPKRKDCPYPFKELSGCGVGFKFLQGFCQNNEIPFDKLYPFMDLVAVSIAADIVPVVDENRILTFYGLQLLNSQSRFGLKALMDIAELRKPIDVASIVFGIAPRLNAGGRVAHASEAIRLLLAENGEEAAKLANTANISNDTRRGFDSNTTQEAMQLLSESTAQAKTTVLFKADWHKGVVGIVASRCIEKLYRPTIILTQANGKATGSARSVNGFDVYEALSECADLLEQYGGHAHAAGLTLPLDNLESFRTKFEAVVAGRISEDSLSPQQEVDCVLELSQINTKFHKVIKQMSPFGPQNMQPIFVSKNVVLNGSPSILKESHLRFSIKQENSISFEAIAFSMAHHFDKLLPKQPFDICYQIHENDYKGRRSLQLMIKDLRF